MFRVQGASAGANNLDRRDEEESSADDKQTTKTFDTLPTSGLRARAHPPHAEASAQRVYKVRANERLATYDTQSHPKPESTKKSNGSLNPKLLLPKH